MRPRLTQLLGLLAFLTLHSLCLFADETVVTETLIAESPSPSPSPVESPAPIVSTTVPPVPEVSPAAVQEVPPSPAPVEEVPVVEPETVVTGETIPIEAVPSPEPAPVPERRRPVKEELLPPPNLFAEHFFLKPELKLKYKTWETNGFVFMETPNREQKSRYSLVTDFAASAMKSQILPGLETVEDVRKWVKDNVKSAVFEGVEVKRVPVPVPSGEEKFRYWVGQKSFATADEARAEIAMIKAISEKEGRDFNAMIQEAARYVSQPEEEPPVEIKTPAQFEKEEEIMLKFIDHLDIGNEMFGPFQGEGTGEPIVWQSFGETSWRMTNLDKKNFSDQVGFWTNRMVFKGLRAPLSTIDPFIEATAALETNGVDSASHLDLSVGLEWRPLGRNPWFLNFRPWSLPLLEFMRNFRFYFQYFDRKNLKDEVEESPDYELQAGVQIFYEWGVDLPPVGEGEPTTVPDYLRRYVWGEYFGSYRYETTDFAFQQFNAFIFNSSVLVGIILPGIPVPENPIMDEFVMMPYAHFEHVNNTQYPFYYQNRLFVGGGVRWMPFRNYRFKENEWLSKTKVFIEYVGVGGAQYTKQDAYPNGVPDYDFRIGVAVSQRRF